MLLVLYLNLVVSDQRFKFLFQPGNTRLESISHHIQINRDKWVGILYQSFATDLIIQCLDMIMQMDVEQQICFKIP